MTRGRKIHYKMDDPSCARYLVVDYIHHRLQKQGYSWTHCPPLLSSPTRLHQTLRNTGDEFEERYRTQFEELSDQLKVTQHTAYPTFCATAQELFDGGVNWGRIVALFAFSGCLARQFCEHNTTELIPSLVDWTATYLEHNLGQWIVTHGGWDGFVEWYDRNPSAENNDSPWDIKGVMKIGVIAGIGAMALGAILNRT